MHDHLYELLDAFRADLRVSELVGRHLKKMMPLKKIS
jgi:hypothetical protein